MPLRRSIPAVASIVVAAGMATAMATPVGSDDPALAPLTFTAAQVSGGRSLYGNNCSGCHGEDLDGLSEAALTGDLFSRWFEGPVADLFNYILVLMPADNPGFLTPRQAAAVVAFILERNGFVAGDIPLPDDADALARIGFYQ